MHTDSPDSESVPASESLALGGSLRAHGRGATLAAFGWITRGRPRLRGPGPVRSRPGLTLSFVRQQY